MLRCTRQEGKLRKHVRHGYHESFVFHYKSFFLSPLHHRSDFRTISRSLYIFIYYKKSLKGYLSFKIPDAGDLMHATMPSPFDSLPVDCISTIISFTSPRDACVAASVSKTFESAVKSDTVWEKFLPSEYSSLIPQYSRVFLSKKELYFALCDDPVLIEDGKKVLTENNDLPWAQN